MVTSRPSSVSLKKSSTKSSRRDTTKTKSSHGIIPTLQPSQVKPGRFLGAGATCSVFDLATVVLPGDEKSSLIIVSTGNTDICDQGGDSEGKVNETGESSLVSIAEGTSFDQSSSALITANGAIVETAKIDKAMRKLADGARQGKYAIKKPQPTLSDDKVRYKAFRDIQIEGKILMTLAHPNIIKIRAVSEEITKELPRWKEYRKSVSQQRLADDEYFLVMDQLTEGSLQSRMMKWAKINSKDATSLGSCGYQWYGFCLSSNVMRTIEDKRQDRLEGMEMERMTIVLGIAKAIRYLHDRK